MFKSVINRIKKRKYEQDLADLLKPSFDLFNSLDKSKRLENQWSNIYPCLNDNTGHTVFDAHYVYHPAWAVRILKKTNPEKHIDISSTLHFCSIVSAFIPIEFYDYRPAILTLNNLFSGEADLTKLHFESNSIDSLSCMHTVEHIGLGRYGDPIDPDADLKAIEELKRVVSVGGSLLFVVPVGKPKIQFNAHRIYDPLTIIEYFKGFSLKAFSLVTDKNEYLEEGDIQLARQQNYGCGCFWLVKEK